MKMTRYDKRRRARSRRYVLTKTTTSNGSSQGQSRRSSQSSRKVARSWIIQGKRASCTSSSAWRRRCQVDELSWFIGDGFLVKKGSDNLHLRTRPGLVAVDVVFLIATFPSNHANGIFAGHS